jgi:hypothetical protein
MKLKLKLKIHVDKREGLGRFTYGSGQIGVYQQMMVLVI